MRKSKYVLLVCALLLSIAIMGFSNGGVVEGRRGEPAYHIIWSSPKVSTAIGPGGSWEGSISFVSNIDLVGAELSVVPELEPFVSIYPQSFSVIVANVPNTVHIDIAVPHDAAVGMAYEGTISLTVRHRTYPQTLKVRLYVAPLLETMTEESYNETMDLETRASELYHQSELDLGTQEARRITLEFLSEQDEVFDAGISEDGSIWIVYKNGIHGLISTSAPGALGSGYQQGYSEALSGTLVSTADSVVPGNRKAILLWTFCSDPTMQPAGPPGMTLTDVMEELSDSLGVVGYEVTSVCDDDVTVDLLKSLYSYGVVDFVTHGNVWSSEVILATGEESTFGSAWAHRSDLAAHRLARRTAITGSNWAIRPSFVTHYASESYPNSIVVATACSSLANYSMADAFLGVGAYVYAGWIGTSHTLLDTELFGYLREGMTVQEAFSKMDDEGTTVCSRTGERFRFYPCARGDFKLFLATLSGLYAGGSNPGVIYKHVGGTAWEVISPDFGYAVLSLVEYEGHLYAGTMSAGSGGVGQVYRYDGGTSWTLVGDNMDSQVASLVVYQDSLYAGTGLGDMKLYRYNGSPNDWNLVVNYTQWYGTRALHTFNDYLLMGDWMWDRFGRWDGTNFYADYDGGGSCIYDYADYGGYVYAAAYYGRLWQSSDGIHWSVVLGYDYGNGHMWELEAFDDELYMAYKSGQLRASSLPNPDRGSLIYTAPDGIISMTTGGNNMYFGTGGEAGYYRLGSGIANVYQYDGTAVVRISGDDEMGAGVQVLYVKD